MTYTEINRFKPGPGRWPHLIMDADGSHSREVDRFFDIVDAELNSDKAAHDAFVYRQGDDKLVRHVAFSAFRPLVRACHQRNPGVLSSPLSEHVERLVAWAILHQWIQNA